jgi:hypothetical protein
MAAAAPSKPRAWREEFDGLKPIRPIAYKKLGAVALKESGGRVRNEEARRSQEGRRPPPST